MAIPGPARIKALTDDELPEDILSNKKLNKVNVIRTLANHPAAFKPWNRFAAYVIGRSELSARQREVVFLRTGWNHQSDYEFGQHRIISKRAGLSDEEILNIARGPDTPGWAPQDKVLMEAADELFACSDITDETWAELDKHYSDLQKVDIIIGVSQYTLVCMMLKSIRVQLDDDIGGLPDIEGSRPAKGSFDRLSGPARIQPLSAQDIQKSIGDNEDLRKLSETIQDLDKINVVATWANHPKAYGHWNRFAAYIFNESELSFRQREIVFLRTGWNHQSDYEWGQHYKLGLQAGLTEAEILAIARGPDTPGWAPEDRVLMVAVDELFNTTDICDETWANLDKHYTDRQKVDVIMGSGNYTLVCMLLKAIRVQLDDNIEGLPTL
jgi:4-carboxymuconolactone decarboxylase